MRRLAAGGATQQLPGSAAGSLVLAGGLTAEPSWLPSAACAAAAHSNKVRCASGVVVPGCPDAHRGLVALFASSVSVCVSSVRPSIVRRRYVSGVRTSGVQCPMSSPCVRVRCERPTSVSTLSAPVSSWNVDAAGSTRLGIGRVG
jgi:hypothetical protein